MSEANARGAEPLVSVVLPVYNEGRVLEALTRGVVAALDDAGCRGEIVYINDGSRDDSAAVLDRLAAADPRVRVLHLSRNFGHQAAVQAGLVHARGDAVVVMDADMQDDPGGIGRFLAKWRAGYDVVYAVRVGRKEGAPKRFLSFHSLEIDFSTSFIFPWTPWWTLFRRMRLS